MLPAEDATAGVLQTTADAAQQQQQQGQEVVQQLLLHVLRCWMASCRA
jgi:hypothetical protein